MLDGGLVDGTSHVRGAVEWYDVREAVRRQFADGGEIDQLSVQSPPLAVNPFYLVDASLIRIPGAAHLVHRCQSIVSISRPSVSQRPELAIPLSTSATVVTDGNRTRSDADANRLGQLMCALLTSARLQRIALCLF